MSTGRKFFEGTNFEDNWFFYHNVLSLMTEKNCIVWMKRKGYYKHWILPELGLNNDIGNFGGRPVRASPEFMPLDASLNKDVHKMVDNSCLLSSNTTKRLGNAKDEREFSMANPTEISKSYPCVFDPVAGVAPSSKRIIQDIDGVFDAIKIVAGKKGVYMQGLAEKAGRRYMKSKQKMGHGGKREAEDPSLRYLSDAKKVHPSLRALMKDAREKEEAKRKEKEAEEANTQEMQQD